MSRAAVSKSRNEKGAKPAPAHTPVVAHEIVPGKFNDQDWNWMIEKDGAEDFVEDIVDEIIDTSLDKIYKLYLERQLMPFTVTMAKDAILQVIEWQFLARDEGETELGTTQEGWIEDEEPEAATTDCWAQGSVPRNIIPPRPISPVAEEFDEHPDDEDEDQEEEVVEEEKVEVKEPEELEDKVSDDEQPIKEEETKQEPVKETKQKKRTKFKPYTGRLKSASVSNMTQSLDESEMKMVAGELRSSYQGQELENQNGLANMPASCHSILKVQAGRPPGNKDVVYDDMGNVVAVVKINPDRLPNHRVKVNYAVVDPSVEAAQARLDAMKHGRYSIQRMRKKKAESKSQVEKSTEFVTKDVKTPLPPPLIEAMELSPGVTVKEGERTRRGPVRYVRRTDLFAASQKNLHPVNSKAIGPTLNVTELLDRHTPILRPIRDSPPLPPIVPHPPTQNRITT